MLHPVGSHPASVYWRRRAVLLGAAVVLIAITAWVLRPGGGDSNTVAGSGSPSHSSAQTSTGSSAERTSTVPSTSTSAHSSTQASGSSGGQSSVGPAACPPAALKIAAVTGAPSYRVGDQPIVMLQVTNAGAVPCVQDLADGQIELRVYNGESRVWGSHDCSVQPGSDPRTLAAGQAVRVSITWSGLSSQPNCAGTRQRVGAGNYTLYAALAGREGAAAQFSIV